MDPWKWDSRHFCSTKLGMLTEMKSNRKEIRKGVREDKKKKHS